MEAKTTHTETTEKVRPPDPSKPRRRRGLLFVTLMLGIAIGVGGTLFLPEWSAEYLPAGWIAENVIQGRVLDKTMEPDRLLLKIDSEQGVFLAAFTHLQPELCLLVDVGDTLVLGFRNYKPFLEDPTIQRVVKPQPVEGLPACDEIPPLPKPETVQGSTVPTPT